MTHSKNELTITTK